jgi:hypothetical protein
MYMPRSFMQFSAIRFGLVCMALLLVGVPAFYTLAQRAVKSPIHERVAANQPQTSTHLTDSLRHTLWVLGPKESDRPLEVEVGDVLQVQPFHTALVPDFINAKLNVAITGELSLQPIGNLSLPANDGKLAHASFLLVREPGTSTVRVNLLDQKGHPVHGYESSFTIRAIPRTEQD